MHLSLGKQNEKYPAIIHNIDIHLEMQHNCTKENVTDKPVQSGR